MKLDMIKIAKEVFKDKELNIEELPGNVVKVHYSGYRVTNLKPIILPKQIKLDENFVEGLGLYIADGKTTLHDIRHIEFTSIDTDVSRFMLNMFIQRFNVTLDNIYIRIRHSNNNENELKGRWSTALGVPREKIIVKRYGKNKTDCCEIHINSKILGSIIRKIIEISLDKIHENVKLNRAFIRGHFAGDGGIESRKNKNSLQIQNVIFAYHKTKEIWIRNFLINLLQLNGIYNLKIRELKGKESAYIRVPFWKNFKGLWKIRLFDLSSRKRDIFMNSVVNSSIYLKLDTSFQRKLFAHLNMTQKEIAGLINCKSEGETCDTIHGKHLLRLEQINNIIKETNFSWQQVIGNSINARVGQRGYFGLEADFINFVLDERKLI